MSITDKIYDWLYEEYNCCSCGNTFIGYIDDVELGGVNIILVTCSKCSVITMYNKQEILDKIL